MSFLETYKFYTPAAPCTKRIAELAAELYHECINNGLGNPFVPGRLQEIIMAGALNHRISETLSGADGYDERGACEYKTTIDKNISGTYSSISVQATWDEQVEYLNQKFGNMNHYIGRFEAGSLIEVWKLDGDKVIELITPSIYKQFNNPSHRKDPRFSTNICMTDIYKHGERII